MQHNAKKLSKYQCQMIPKKSWNKITQSFQIPLNNKKYTINVCHSSHNYVVQALEYIIRNVTAIYLFSFIKYYERFRIFPDLKINNEKKHV